MLVGINDVSNSVDVNVKFSWNVFIKQIARMNCA